MKPEFMNELVQRPAKIRKCRVGAELSLQVDSETFREQPVAVRKKYMNKLVEDRRLAGHDAPPWKFHVTRSA